MGMKVRKTKKVEARLPTSGAGEVTNSRGGNPKLELQLKKEKMTREAVLDANSKPMLSEPECYELKAAKWKKMRKSGEDACDAVSTVRIPKFDKRGQQGSHKRKEEEWPEVSQASNGTSNIEEPEEESHIQGKRAKKRKRGGSDNNAYDEKPTKGTKELCLAYLRVFGSPEWKYCKKQQHWLISNAFDESLLGEDDFLLFLRYIENMKGRARDRLQALANKFLENVNSEGDDDALKAQYERARSILQMLA